VALYKWSWAVGILETGTIFTTQVSCMNDRAEVSFPGDNCAGDSDGHATAFTLGSRHVPFSKSRAAAGGSSACVGH
jgi:hypothetical protein